MGQLLGNVSDDRCNRGRTEPPVLFALGGWWVHGCADAKALVPNLDWTIYVPLDPTKHAFKPLGKKVNVDEAKCDVHPTTTGEGRCQSSPSPVPSPPHGHPVPAPSPRPYDSIGSIDVGTLENTIFWWRNRTYVLENIGCNYSEHRCRSLAIHAPTTPHRLALFLEAPWFAVQCRHSADPYFVA